MAGTPNCPYCSIDMSEYYVGFLPIGALSTVEKVTTYLCEGCGLLLFYAKDLVDRRRAMR